MAARPLVGFRVEGLGQVVRDLQQVGVEVDDLKDAFGKISQRGAQVAAGLVPTGRTGRLKASIRGNRAKGKAVVTAGRANVPYAGAINYGWPKRNIRPHEFMQRTDDRMRPVAIDMLETEIDNVVRKRGLK